MANRIQLRRGGAQEWRNANPILAQGEVGIDLDSGRIKIGDGSTAWNSLSYERPPESIANTANSLVQRDADGNFSAGVITASIIGNASTATRLSNIRQVQLTGDIISSGVFDGSANLNLNAELKIVTTLPHYNPTDVNATGQYTRVVVDSRGRVVQASNPSTIQAYNLNGTVEGQSAQPYDNDLGAIAALTTNGISVRVLDGNWVTRTITGTANQTVITNGSGTAGNPVIDLALTTVTPGNYNTESLNSVVAAGPLGEPYGTQTVNTVKFTVDNRGRLQSATNVPIATATEGSKYDAYSAGTTYARYDIIETSNKVYQAIRAITAGSGAPTHTDNSDAGGWRYLAAAATEQKGLASFAQEDFDVDANGHVAIASRGVDNTQLQNNRISFADGNTREDFELDQELTASTGYRGFNYLNYVKVNDTSGNLLFSANNTDNTGTGGVDINVDVNISGSNIILDRPGTSPLQTIERTAGSLKIFHNVNSSTDRTLDIVSTNAHATGTAKINVTADDEINLQVTTAGGYVKAEDIWFKSNIITSSNSTIVIDPAAEGDATGSVQIRGDLLVDGTTTTINSTTVTIDDPIITLGGDTTPSVDDNKDRGVEFRYYDTQARLGFYGWDDSYTTLAGTTGGYRFLYNATNTSEVFTGTDAGVIAGNLALSSNVGSTNTSTGTLVVTGGAGISQNLWVGGTANVAGNTTLQGTLGVTDNVTLNKNVTLVGSDTAATEYFKIQNGSAVDKFVVDSSSGNTAISGTLGVTGAALLSSTLGVSGVTSITNATDSAATTSGALVVTGGVGIGKQLRVGGAAAIGGNASITGTLGVTSSSTFTGNLTTQSGSYVHIQNIDNPTVITDGSNNYIISGSDYGAFRNDGGGYFGQDVLFANDIYVNGAINVKDAGDGGTASTVNSLTVRYRTILGSTIAYTPSFATDTNSNARIVGGAGIATTLHIGGTSANQGLFVGKRISSDTAKFSVLGATGNTSISGTLGVAGVTSITNATDSSATNNGALVVTGGAGIGGQLRVGGATALGSTLSVTGVTSITNATDSSATSNGALVVTGGVGVGAQLRVGGAATVTGATTLSSTLAVTSSTTLTGNLTTQSASTVSVQNPTDASSVSSAAMTIAGGLGIAKNLYVGGNVFLGDSTADSVTIAGNLTINGTTTTVNSTTITVDDKNIELGSVAVPDNTTADGGGITLRGASNKTINWIQSTTAWTSSEHWNLASGKEYRINGTAVIDSSRNLTNIGNITSTGTISNTGSITSTTGGTLNAVRIGVTAAGEIDTSSGNLIIDSAGGTTTVDDALTVSGLLTANAGITLSGSTGAGENFTITDGTTTKFSVTSAAGNTTIEGTLSLTGTATLNNSVTIVGSNSAATEFFRIQNGSAGNTFVVDTSSGNTTISGTVDVTETSTFRKSITLVGSAVANTDKFTITNGAGTPVTTFEVDSSSGNTTSTGVITLTNATAQTVTGVSYTSDGAFRVTGGAGITGNVAIGGNLRVFGASVISGGVTYSGTQSYNGVITQSNSTDAASSTDTAASISTAGGVAIAKKLFVGGAVTLSSTLGVTSATTLSSTLGVTGVTSITNATDSSATNNGALVVTGGVGIGSQLRVAGNATFGTNVTITGDLTVNGTTTTINSTVVSVDDKNIELGSVAVPSNITADGGGITLRGTSDKTFSWINATSAWTSSEHLNLANGKEYRIDGTAVISSARALTNITAIATSGQLTSTVATGTAPFVVASTTKVDNLNADLLDGFTTATANTVSTVVVRDSSGNFAAGTITATLSGNVTGSVTGTVSSLSNHTTTNLSEGTNLYYTDERVDDRVASLVVGGTGITSTYVDNGTAAGSLTLALDFTEFSTSNITEGTKLFYTPARFDTALATKTTNDLTEGLNGLYFTNERVDDRVNDLLIAGTGIQKTYDDANTNTLTLALDFTEFSTTNITEGTKLFYTDSRVQSRLDDAYSQLEAMLAALGTSTTVVLNLSGDPTPGDVVTFNSGSLVGGNGGFTAATGVATTTNGSGTGLTVNTTVVSGAITAVAINNDGTGYQSSDTITITNPNAGGVFTFNTGTLVQGTGYTTATNVPTTGGGGNGLTVNITASGGLITNVAVNNPGTGYTTGDTVTITGGNGNGAINVSLVFTDATIDVATVKAMAIGQTITGGTSEKTGVITAVGATSITVDNVTGFFKTGETIQTSGPTAVTGLTLSTFA